MLNWLFRNRETGRITIAHLPNVSLSLFLATAVVKRGVAPSGTVGTSVAVVGTLALVWWVVDEVVRGVNPWRRILGGTVFVATVVGAIT